jgi:hypothetical protein
MPAHVRSRGFRSGNLYAGTEDKMAVLTRLLHQRNKVSHPIRVLREIPSEPAVRRRDCDLVPKRELFAAGKELVAKTTQDAASFLGKQVAAGS